MNVVDMVRCPQCGEGVELAPPVLREFFDEDAAMPEHDYRFPPKHMCPSCSCEQPKVRCPGSGGRIASGGIRIRIIPDVPQ